MGDACSTHEIFENPEIERDYLIDINIDWKILIKLILEKTGLRFLNYASSSGWGPVEGPSTYGNEAWGSIKCRGYLNQMSNCQRLKRFYFMGLIMAYTSRYYVWSTAEQGPREICYCDSIIFETL
jgi:hypothetical protein